MKQWRFYPLLALLVVMAMVLAACPAPAAAPAQEAAPAAQEAAPAAAEAPTAAAEHGATVKVYTSWPLQGPMLPEGDSMKKAVDLALKHHLDAHDGHGPAGLTIEIVNLDDASPTTGSWDGTIEAENAQKCVNDADCMVYFGTYNSGAAKISMPITNRAGIAQITPANTYPGLTHAWDQGEPEIYRPSGKVNYFRTNAADDVQGWAGASWAKCLGYDTVYLLDDRQLYGKGVVDAFIQQAEKVGIEIVGRDGVESSDIDFRSLLTKVKAANPKLVYGGFVIDSGGPQVIQQMGSLGLFDLGIKFMGPDGLVNPALVEQVGGAEVANENVLLTFPGLAPSQLTSEAGKKFFDDFQAEYGMEPSPWSTYAYQAMQVILDSIDRAGKADRTAILDAMAALDGFEGVTGVFGFNENGDPTVSAMGGNIVRDGNIEYIGAISPDMVDAGTCDTAMP
ncbi:MAG: branched-chain amino acid ABC transporter substrate-binding protein [Caldilineaceae bacterium]|nr:branched-chain amino acid ABC transporter substrate-binding protein [Caldilineaceae bacterium]HRJ40775.1 branched-chain amino acid ABC transporter substrate-binding protein [Caldilineaceae bacterium]